MFATVNIVAVTFAFVYGLDYALKQAGNMAPAFFSIMLNRLAVAFAAYLVGFLVTVRVVIGIVRINNNPRVEIGIAALIAVAVLSALVPYSVGLHLNDYRSFAYSNWQVTNWAWTLTEIVQGRYMDRTIVFISVTVSVAFFACLLSMPQLASPRRTATPTRVKEELDAIKDE